MSADLSWMKDGIQELRKQGLEWNPPTLEGASQPKCIIDGQEMLMLSSNNYLNLTTHPKVVQASMGSICRVNISYMDFQKLLDGKNYNTVAADLEGQNLKDFTFSENQIIFFGSESNGFSKKLSSQIDHKITIQRYNDNVESLNLATSVGIILSELKSQITGK